MDPSSEHSKDPQFDQIVNRLSYPKAPSSLAANVLERLRAEQNLVWWRRPILTWPLAARCFGVGWLLALAIGVAYALGAFPMEAVAGENLANSPMGLISFLVQVLSSLGSAFQACLAAVPAEVWWLLGGVLAIAYVGCLALGTFIYRRIFLSHS